MLTTIDRERPAAVQSEILPVRDHSDQLWDGHGLFVAMVLVTCLVLISVVAIHCINLCTPARPAATSAMLLIADPALDPPPASDK